MKLLKLLTTTAMSLHTQAFVRLARNAPLRSATSRIGITAHQTTQGASHRTFASTVKPNPTSSKGVLVALVGGLTLAGGAGYFFSTAKTTTSITPPLKSPNANRPSSTAPIPSTFVPQLSDYQAVYNEIARLLVERDEWDDGSYGPVVLRLAWHCSGTYDAATNTGGSNGATMRFDPESEHSANNGLAAARTFLEPVKQKFPWITYSDLWTLAGVCAVQEMAGPTVPWRPGRADRDVSYCTPDGRLPDGAKGPPHLRDIFGRMGFNDQEIVALSGAHALGRCHTERSGFEGPWTFSPTIVTNDYFKLLLDEKWHWRTHEDVEGKKKWTGKAQWQDTTKGLMMLPTDMALVEDGKMKEWVEAYAKDNERFFRDFGAVLTKLFELGVPFKEPGRLELRRADEEEEA